MMYMRMNTAMRPAGVLPKCSMLIALLAIALSPQIAGAWGDEGHRTVAAIAALGLNDHAKALVQELLGASPGQESARMEKVASWADDVRGWHKNWAKARGSNHGIELDDAAVKVPDGLKNQATEKALAKSFILALVESQTGSGDPVQLALEQQSNRHFTNLPFGTTSYPSATTGTGPNDCVQGILRCVKVLKGHPLSGEIMNKQQALRFLIHYVGDLHQPLHAAVGYWLPTSDTDATARLCSPQEAPTGVNDIGGNNLEFADHQPTMNFHMFWDGDMVKSARDAEKQSDSETFAQVTAHFRDHLKGLISQSAPWGLSGSIAAAVKSWDVSSTNQSETAYSTLIHDELQVKKTGNHFHLSGKVKLPDGYAENNRAIVNKQLARGGLHLAMVLNSI